MQGLRTNSTLFLGPREGRGEAANSDFGPRLALRTPKNAGVMYQFHPLLGPREGKGEAANSDFVPLFGDPRECKGSIAIPPSFGPPGRQG